MKRVLSLAGLVFGCGIAYAEFPEGFAPGRGLSSPNGQYGILLPDDEHISDDPKATVNYLADLRAERVLKRLVGCYYWSHSAHRTLTATWSENSQRALVEMGERYGFSELVLVEIQAGKVRQTKLGEAVRRVMEAAVTPATVYATTYGRFTDGLLHLYALGSTNPRNLGEEGSQVVLFEGRYSVIQHRWVTQTGRVISSELEADLAYALQPMVEVEEGKGTGEVWDACLNRVYRGLQAVLPVERFARVKREQLAWLAKRDGETDVAVRGELVRRRVVELQALFW